MPFKKVKSLIPESFSITSVDLKLFSDAFSIGLGVIYNQNWIQYRWVCKETSLSIDFQELFVIVAAIYTWGGEWEGKRIVVVTDNLPITQIWHSGTTKSKSIMYLIRKLYLFAAQIGFSVSFKHISGTSNCIVDSLSRFQVERFRHVFRNVSNRCCPKPATYDRRFTRAF